MILDDYFARLETEHQAEVERGEHDLQCEWRPRQCMCHCSKRRREAAGHTEPPELDWQAPLCTRCWNETESDADGYTCDTCSAFWNHDGTFGHFTDDYGELTPRPIIDVQLPPLPEEVHA
ncbi:hypothetical protein [Prauserella muralis]|uniref:Uncharacterized protein n=1 Tax=Prauserella muralis TaxID=588067 RepID=A0A2V4BCS0_9PSEU|nr:hypothetical protein [Prauserella muralis]PXY27409.1 hypothetical protein BAY60_13320 [Prauserella muralis]TWE22894.1 hypothetical protein FHX69_4150 [Prauserella muralis]